MTARLSAHRLALAGLTAATLVLPAAAEARPLRGTAAITGPEQFTQEVPPYISQSLIGPFAMGDVDGDHLADWSPWVWRHQFGENERDLAYTAFGVFGRQGSRSIDLERDPGILRYDLLAHPGFQRAGDINGDGTEDLYTSASENGDIAVVFGGPWTRTAAFTPAAGGFRIQHAAGSLSPIGDVNGDGKDDLLAYSSATRAEDVGAIIFGSTANATVDAQRPGARGVLLRNTGGYPVWNQWGGVPAGDFNGDGLGDFAVMPSSGSVGAIVYGARFWSTVDVAAPGSRGRLVRDVLTFVPTAADVTGDRRDDLLALQQSPSDPENHTIHVVPGAATSSPATLGTGTLPIEATADAANFGTNGRVAPIGDQTGDGRADLLVAPSPYGEDAGVRLVAGRASGVLPTLSSPAVQGVGAAGFVTALGDVDGDGSPDAFAQTPWPLHPDARRYGTLITRGADVLAPEWLADPQATPSAFRVGPNATKLTARTTEDGALALVVRTAAGATVGTVRIPGGPDYSGAWDGRVGGRALPAGDYRTTVTPIDPSGNKGAARTVAFTVLPSA